MKRLMQLGLCGLLAQGVFAGEHGVAGARAASGGHAGSVTTVHKADRAHGLNRTYRYGRYGGYGYGGYFEGYYDPFYDSGYHPSAEPGGSNMTTVYPPPAPSVMATETAHSVIHEYGQPEDYGTPPGPESSPILYLIAFRDTTIRAAMTYWVADGVLHYLDTNHQEKQAALSSVDRDLSAQLNRERHVPFNVP